MSAVEFVAFLIIALNLIALLNAAQPLNEHDWTSVSMPTKSLYAGFTPPSDQLKWKEAQEKAASGKQFLLQKVIDQVVYPGEIISGDINFGWLHRLGDIFTSDKKPIEDELAKSTSGIRAAITLIGYFDYTHMDGEGSFTNFYGYGPGKILEKYKNEKFTLPKKIVGIGHMNENWGWLSTHMTNRSCTWGFGFSSDYRYSPVTPLEQMLPFLDDPNLVMLLVNQHHNVSHPKVISLPRGVLRKNTKMMWNEAIKVLHEDMRKDTLLFSASSQYRHRPYIVNCVKENMGTDLTVHLAKSGSQNLGPEFFTRRLMGSIGVLAVPGMGYDCWRIWETLLAGSIPVMEKGTGLDRSLYRLPALLLDDFADVTPELMRQAYVEALYRIDDWDYTRITERHWQRLIYMASRTGNIEYMLKLHPMEAEDPTFTRPLMPFDCEKMGGCGVGTKRVPKKSCAIDTNTDFSKYDWMWFETADENRKRDRANAEKVKEKKGRRQKSQQ